MGDNAAHRDGPQWGSCGDHSGVVSDPLTQTDVNASRAEFNGRKAEKPWLELRSVSLRRPRA